MTFEEIAIGFPIGALSGIWTGYLFGRSKALAEIFEPIIIALYGMPRTALAPLFIVWLGIGIWSKVGVVFILVFFLNFFNTYTGMRQMDQEFVDLARLMGANRWRLSFRVILPAMSPYIITGFKTSIPFSVIGAIIGEFIAATEGLGYFIRAAAGIFRTADVFVGIVVLMIIVIIMNKVADLIERRVLRWQTQTENVQVQGSKEDSMHRNLCRAGHRHYGLPTPSPSALSKKKRSPSPRRFPTWPSRRSGSPSS